MTIHLANLADLRALGRGSNTIPPPDFFIPLTSSLALSRGVGSPTFTRSTTATVWGYDNSGNWTLLTIPSGTPRFDGARWTGSAWTNTFPDGSAIPDATLKGYLVEGQRTNLLTYSEQFDNPEWSKLRTTVLANSAIAPDGTMTADKIQEDNTNDSHTIYRDFSKSASALTYTFSAYVKPAERTWVEVVLWDGVNNVGNRYWFNLASGIVGSTSIIGTGFTNTSYAITPASNGFYRLTVTATSSAAEMVSAWINVTTGDGVDVYTGTTGSGFYLWGAQLEQASFASSYIPTTSATVTRNADVLTYPTSGNILSEKGTSYAEFNPISSTPAGNSILDVSDAVQSYNALLTILSNRFISFFDSTSNILTANTAQYGVMSKAASLWGSSMRKAVLNGGSIASGSFDGSALATSSPKIRVGSSTANDNFYGNIRNVKIWKKALSDSKLISLTR